MQRAYGECALGYGFKIDPCPPRDPQKKGIVESGVKYVKSNFLPLREFRDLTDLNEQGRHWVLHEAGLRIHGTTRQTPLSLFELERHTLQALPAIAPDMGTWVRATVHRDCHLKFDSSLYSAPFALVHQRLWVRVTDCSVAIFHEYQHVHTHPRARRRGERLTVTDHLPPDAVVFLAHDRQYCLERAGAIGAACHAFITALLEDRILERLRTAQNVLRLAKTYGTPRLDAACARAITHDSLHYRTVKSILAGGYDKLPAEQFLDQPYAKTARFARDAERPVYRAARSAALKRKEYHRMNPSPELAPQLKQLRLSGIMDSLEARNRQAIEAKMPYVDFLAALIGDEVARRDQKKFSPASAPCQLPRPQDTRAVRLRPSAATEPHARQRVGRRPVSERARYRSSSSALRAPGKAISLRRSGSARSARAWTPCSARARRSPRV